MTSLARSNLKIRLEKKNRVAKNSSHSLMHKQTSHAFSSHLREPRLTVPIWTVPIYRDSQITRTPIPSRENRNCIFLSYSRWSNVNFSKCCRGNSVGFSLVRQWLVSLNTKSIEEAQPGPFDLFAIFWILEFFCLSWNFSQSRISTSWDLWSEMYKEMDCWCVACVLQIQSKDFRLEKVVFNQWQVRVKNYCLEKIILLSWQGRIKNYWLEKVIFDE